MDLFKNLPKLKKDEIAVFKIKENKNDDKNNLAWLSWLITGLEIGLSFIPGVGEIGQLAIGLISAGALTGVSYAEDGEVSVTDLALNFGGAFIPGGMSVVRKGMSNINIGRKLLSNAEGLFEESDRILEEAFFTYKWKNYG